MSQGLSLSRAAIQELLGRELRHPGSSPVVILEGDSGDGRSLLVESAASTLRQEGVEIELKGLDLDGWEPEGGASLWNAASAALGAGGGAAVDREGFQSALHALAPPGGTLALHVTDTLTLPDLLLDALLCEAASLPGFLLILQASPGGLSARAPALPAVPSQRLRPEPLPLAGVRTALQADFGDDAWALLRGVAALPLPGEEAEVLQRFLALAGLCGTAPFPAQLLLAAAGGGEETADTLLDALDQIFVERGLLEDLEYGHPSFPDQAVYRFGSPLAARAAREALPDFERDRRAADLLIFLRERLGPRTRGAGRLLAGLARGEERERALQELAWWTGEPESDAQERWLDAAVAGGRLPADSLWNVFEGVRERWPAYRSLPLANLYGHRAAVPAFRTGELSASRAMLLLDLGRGEEAAQAAREALEKLDRRGQEARLTVACQAVLGLTSLAGGDLAAARDHLAAVAEAAAEAAPGDGTPDDVAALSRELRELPAPDLLRQALTEALRISRQVEGFEGRRGADLWGAFSDLFRDGGKLVAARESLERALTLSRRLTAPVDAQTAIALKNLADLQHSLGEAQGERQALEGALAIESEIFGPDAERTVALRAHLIELLLSLEDFAGARPLREPAVEIARGADGAAGDPVVLLKHLGDVCRRQGDAAAAAEHLSEALALEEATYGEDDPRITVLLKQLSDLHRALGDPGQGVAYRLRVLRVEEGIYGPEHPRLLPNLKILEALASRPEGADEALADSLRHRVRRIESRRPA